MIVDLLVSTFYHGQDEDDEALMVDADDVLQLLKDFIQEKDRKLLVRFGLLRASQ